MPYLTARYSINLVAPLLVEFPNGISPKLELSLDGFYIIAELVAGNAGRFRNRQNLDWRWPAETLIVGVSRMEADEVPQIVEVDGRKDLTPQSQHLRKIAPDYQRAALTVANRLLQYFRHSVGTPHIHPLEEWGHELSNPIWFDGTGSQIRDSPRSIMVSSIPGDRNELGIRALVPSELQSLKDALTHSGETSLIDELLADARDACAGENHRRAVLELAICAEILTKRRFFSADSTAGAAFDYLEDKGKANVKVLELLDQVATEAFSKSFKKEAPDDFKQIDFLFRCRNKVAHRGALVFKDDSGALVVPDWHMVEQWWSCVARLKDWLNSCTA